MCAIDGYSGQRKEIWRRNYVSLDAPRLLGRQLKPAQLVLSTAVEKIDISLPVTGRRCLSCCY